MAFLGNCPADCYDAVKQSTVDVMTRLQQSLALQAEASQLSEIQTQLCALLQTLLKRLDPSDVAQVADGAMSIFLSVFHASAGAQLNAVQEDALMAMSALIDAVKEGFSKYMPAVSPFLLKCLGLVSEHQVCFVAVGVVGDVCRALSGAVQPYAPAYMAALLSALSQPLLDRSVKPQILSCFGDIASAIGPAFRPHLDVVMEVLQQASAVASQPVDDEDYDLADHVAELREGCLEAFTGILAALRAGSESEVGLITVHVPRILSFVETVTSSANVTEENIRSSLGLVGDLCAAFGPQLSPVLSASFTDRLVALGKSGKDKTTRELGKWARGEIKKIRSPSA